LKQLTMPELEKGGLTYRTTEQANRIRRKHCSHLLIKITSFPLWEANILFLFDFYVLKKRRWLLSRRRLAFNVNYKYCPYCYFLFELIMPSIEIMNLALALN